MQTTWPMLITIINNSSNGVPCLASPCSSSFWVVITLGGAQLTKPCTFSDRLEVAGTWSLQGHKRNRFSWKPDSACVKATGVSPSRNGKLNELTRQGSMR